MGSSGVAEEPTRSRAGHTPLAAWPSAPTCASGLGAPWPHYPMPPAAGLRSTGRAEAPTTVQDRRWRRRSPRSAQGGPRQRRLRQRAASRASLRHCAGWRGAAAAEEGCCCACEDAPGCAGGRGRAERAGTNF